MIYLLDTNVAVAIIRDRPAQVRTRLRQVIEEGGTVSVPTIVLFELWYGAARGEHGEKNRAQVHAFLAGGIEVLPFEGADAEQAGRVRADLEGRGGVIGPFDLLIAGQALRQKATLVTANVREFSRIDDLIWEDWAAIT